MFTLERAHELLREQGLEDGAHHTVGSLSFVRERPFGTPTTNTHIEEREQDLSLIPALIPALIPGKNALRVRKLRAIIAVAIGTIIGSLLGSFLT